MTCKIEGCPNPVYGHGLCAKHYFRQRRHGDPGVTHKPGPKPSKPKPDPRVVAVEGIEVEALRKQLDQANAEIRELKRALASAQEQGRARTASSGEVKALQDKISRLEIEVSHRRFENDGLREQLAEARTMEFGVLQQKNTTLRNSEASLRYEIRALREQLAEAKKPRSESEEVATLQRKLKGAQTRISNLTQERTAVRRLLDDARKANPAFVDQAKYRTMVKAFHPDSESRVSQVRKAELTAAAQVFNDLVKKRLEDAIKKTKAEERKAEQSKGSQE